MKHSRLAEQGSMFLVALIALSVLTLIGLSLAMVAETEMIMGANEWVVTETHFAAEAGINVAMAQLLVTADPSPVDFVVPSYFGLKDERNQIGFEIKSSGSIDVDRGPLPYSTANMTAGNQPQYVYSYTTVRSQRTAWSQGKETPDCNDTQEKVLGQKHLMTALYYAPMDAPSSESLIAEDRAGRDKIFSEDFLCEWEFNQNDDFDKDLVETESNAEGSVNDVLTRGNPFYYGYTAGS